MSKTIFVCQVTDTVLKVIKLQRNGNPAEAVAGLRAEKLASGIDSALLAEKIGQALKELEYKNNRVILSLPRNHAACRYLKVPAQAPREIEKIVSLQAATYLPYPANELITGFQVISTDKAGYSHINLVIVHRDVIERYIRLFKELKITDFSIFLSSYGAAQLYSYIDPQEARPVMLADIDSQQVEITVTLNNKLLYSRYFKLNILQPDREEVFVDEINKTNDAYQKEVPSPGPQKIVILGAPGLSGESREKLSRQLSLPVELLPDDKQFNVSEGNSFASLIGLGLAEAPESLNLLPQITREENRKSSQRNENFRLALSIFGIVIILSAATAKNLDNQRQYLKQLKSELGRLAKEARPLEEIENRLRIAQNQNQKKPSSLEILYEVHKVIPDNISLTNLSYEEDNQTVIHGQAPELDSVFGFVAQLEKSAVFKAFSIKVRYATKKKIQASEVVDFEIACVREK